jgi:hypothetical protein
MFSLSQRRNLKTKNPCNHLSVCKFWQHFLVSSASLGFNINLDKKKLNFRPQLTELRINKHNFVIKENG